MFQFLFKYPRPVFTKGHFVFLGTWPAWLLALLVVASGGALAVLVWRNLGEAAPNLRSWRAWAIWGTQSALIALILFLLWQPAMVVGELSSQQNIVAVVVDDSRSMAIADESGRTREAAALDALNHGLLAGLKQRFQTRLYTIGSALQRPQQVKAIVPEEAATHLSDGLKQLAAETSDLPIGAVLLLSDGGENTAGLGGTGIGADALLALRDRRLPVHTIGFGSLAPARDVEIEDVSLAPKAVAGARVAATISLVQHGYTGQRATLTVRDGSRPVEETQKVIRRAVNPVIQ